MHGVLELVSIPYGAEIVQYIGMDIVASTLVCGRLRPSMPPLHLANTTFISPPSQQLQLHTFLLSVLVITLQSPCAVSVRKQLLPSTPDSSRTSPKASCSSPTTPPCSQQEECAYLCAHWPTKPFPATQSSSKLVCADDCSAKDLWETCRSSTLEANGPCN